MELVRYYTINFKTHTVSQKAEKMRDVGFSRRWRFNLLSSVLRHRVVLW